LGVVGLTNLKLEEIVGFAAEAIGTALEKKVHDTVDNIKQKITKRLREDEPELVEQSQTQNDPEEATHYIPRGIQTGWKQSFRRTYRTKRYAKTRRNKVFYSNYRGC